MSLFISGLAFQDPGLENEAKVGILAGSLLAASVGALIIRSNPSS
jgi:Na+/H+ antiporter NhaA